MTFSSKSITFIIGISVFCTGIVSKIHTDIPALKSPLIKLRDSVPYVSANVYEYPPSLDTLDNYFDFYTSAKHRCEVGVTVMWEDQRIRAVMYYPDLKMRDTIFFKTTDPAMYKKTRWYYQYKRP